MTIAVVTDSTSDIPSELAHSYQIRVVPNTIVIEGKSLVDGVDITRQEFYNRLPLMKSPPTTAATSSGAYQEVYESLFAEGYSEILSIHASSLLSAIYNAARIASESFDNKVRVIDSQQVSMGLGFQVLQAAEAVAVAPSGRGMNMERTLELLEEFRLRVRVVAMLDTLEYVRRSGRVSWARARLGELLNIKPFIELREGKVLSRGEARTHRKGYMRLLEMLRGFGPLERLAVLHTNAEEEARQFLEDYGQPLPAEPLLVNITTVIGAHIGPHALGFAAVTQQRTS
jgi:DegV family protein with EDD domain